LEAAGGHTQDAAAGETAGAHNTAVSHLWCLCCNKQHFCCCC
jgi:hypothetical protein